MTNEPVCETETDLQTERADVWLPRRRDGREGWTGRLGFADANCYGENG